MGINCICLVLDSLLYLHYVLVIFYARWCITFWLQKFASFYNKF